MIKTGLLTQAYQLVFLALKVVNRTELVKLLYCRKLSCFIYIELFNESYRFDMIGALVGLHKTLGSVISVAELMTIKLCITSYNLEKGKMVSTWQKEIFFKFLTED